MEVLAAYGCRAFAGIKGYVDLNIYNGSYYDLKQMTIGRKKW